MRYRNPQRGFSLIELMVTIAVLAILASVAAPNMMDFIDKRRLVSQTEAISELMQLARSEAIKHSSDVAPKTVTATISPGTSWFIGLSNTGTTPCDNGSTPCEINEAGTAITKVVTATECTGCTLNITDTVGTAVTSPVTFVFDLRGLVTAGTEYWTVLQSPRGRQLRVSVSAIGRISTCAPSGSIVPGYQSCP